MGSVEWTNNQVIRLVEEYRRRRVLWDPRSDQYRAQSAKYEAWSELAARFSCEIVDVRMKLNSIFASHRREKGKVRSGGRSTWFLYPHLDFLPTHLRNNDAGAGGGGGDGGGDGSGVQKTNKRKLKLDEEEQEEEQYCAEDVVHDSDLDSGSELLVKEERYRDTFVPKKYKPRAGHNKPRLKIVKRHRTQKETSVSQLDGRLLETLRLLRRSEMSRKKDECDSFGEYIADSLRKHDERTQSMIKQAINNILFEQEMKRYSSEQYTVLIASENENPLT